jgi:hypothetical protein
VASASTGAAQRSDRTHAVAARSITRQKGARGMTNLFGLKLVPRVVMKDLLRAARAWARGHLKGTSPRKLRRLKERGVPLITGHVGKILLGQRVPRVSSARKGAHALPAARPSRGVRFRPGRSRRCRRWTTDCSSAWWTVRGAAVPLAWGKSHSTPDTPRGSARE